MPWYRDPDPRLVARMRSAVRELLDQVDVELDDDQVAGAAMSFVDAARDFENERKRDAHRARAARARQKV